MNQDRVRKLNELFEALSIIADGSYVFLCDMKENYSCWSQSAVDFFSLPDTHMKNAGEIWEQRIHPEDRKSYHEKIGKYLSGGEIGHDMQYRAMARDGTYAMCTGRCIILRDDDGNPEFFGGTIKNHGLMVDAHRAGEGRVPVHQRDAAVEHVQHGSRPYGGVVLHDGLHDDLGALVEPHGVLGE